MRIFDYILLARPTINIHIKGMLFGLYGIFHLIQKEYAANGLDVEHLLSTYNGTAIYQMSHALVFLRNCCYLG